MNFVFRPILILKIDKAKELRTIFINGSSLIFLGLWALLATPYNVIFLVELKICEHMPHDNITLPGSTRQPAFLAGQKKQYFA